VRLSAPSFVLMFLGGVILPSGGAVARIQETGDDPIKLGECVMRMARPLATAVALSIPGSAEENRLFAELNSTILNCKGAPSGAMSIDQKSLFMGAISSKILAPVTVYHSGWSGRPNLDAAAQMMAVQSQGYPLRSAMAKCLVFVDTNNAFRFIKSRSGSNNEKKLASALTPSLTRCVDKGVNLSMSLQALRAETTRAFARYVCAPNDPPASGKVGDGKPD